MTEPTPRLQPAPPETAPPETAPLETGRLLLEPLQVDHAAEMVAVLGDAALYEFTGGKAPSLRDLERRYEAQVAGPGRDGEQWHNWIVRVKETNAAAGFVQATVEATETTSEIEVAWVIGVAHQGQGVATEASRAMVDWFTNHGHAAVKAFIHPEHIASNRVASALGLTKTAFLDEDGEVLWATAATAIPESETPSQSPG